MALFLRKTWRQKPPESWQIDWGHPLTDGLASFITADGDHVSGSPLVLMGSARRQADGTMYSPGGSSDGAYVSFAARLLDITGSFTTISFCSISKVTSYSTLLSVPYRSGYWNAPYAVIQLNKYASSGTLRAQIGYGSSSFSGLHTNNNSLVLADNIYSCRAFSKTKESLFFYKDGVSFSDTTYDAYSDILSKIPDFTNRQPICIANHGNSSPGEATGGIYGPSVFYSRALSVAELAAIDENPWQIFAPRRLYCTLSVTSSPATGAGVTAARMAPSAGTAQARTTVAGSPAASLLHTAAPASVACAASGGATVTTHLPAVVPAATPHGAAKAAAPPAMSAVVAPTGPCAFASALAEALPAFLDAAPGQHAGTPVAIVVPAAVQASLAARAATAAAATTTGATASVLRLLARSLAGDIAIHEVARLASPITTTVRRASAVAVALRLASPIETEQA